MVFHLCGVVPFCCAALAFVQPHFAYLPVAFGANAAKVVTNAFGGDKARCSSNKVGLGGQIWGERTNICPPKNGVKMA